ncbi:MAG: pilus assembly protein [Sphingopyxis sp.]|nr:MAG: pilus assembly protein [Sphingopyxis sp.]
MLKSKLQYFPTKEAGHQTGAARDARRSPVGAMCLGMLAAFFVSAPVYAFSPVQAPILIASAVSPNVLILLDNSLSMKNAIAPLAVSETGYSRAGYYDGASYQLVRDNMPLSSITSGGAGAECTTGWKALYAMDTGAATARKCFRLPDPVGKEDTWYSQNYLSYIYHAYSDGQDLTGVLPNEYRMDVARKVTSDIVSENRGPRYGLFTFNPPVYGDVGPGGSLRLPVKDFSKTLSPTGSVLVSEEQAQANLDAFLAEIKSTNATTFTPLAETYYEMTRYLRGLSRFQGARAASAPANYESPIQYRCQRTYGVVVTDGLPTYDTTFPASDPDEDNPAVTGSDNLPDWDGDSDSDGLYLDDIAKFAYEVDMRNNVALDLAGKSFNQTGFAKQNMQTYTIGFTINNDLLQDAAGYGRGRYYTANNSGQLKASLTQAINSITAQAGSGGAGASSSATLTADTVYYKTLYDPATWSGTIEAYKLDPVTGRPSTLLWSTDDTLAATADSASYQTYNPERGQPVALNFAPLSQAQKDLLDSSVSSPLSGIDLVAWAKGGSVEGLRDRSSLLGDIVNSSLERVAPQTQTVSAITSDAGYDSYLSFKGAELEDSVVVNANGGFFHVLDATDGRHRYAYMPSSVLPLLNIVADPDYLESGSHRFLVDGQIAISDAQLGTTWSTVAVSGMGAGGKSMFAVRLFQQSTSAPNTPAALWEITPPAENTPSDDWNDLGYTYSRAAIARTKSNQWVAVFGNGYGSHTGKAALYIVDLQTGELVRKIVVDENVGPTAGYQTNGNGLSSAQVVVNAQHQIEKIYAGDLRGNLWNFDLSTFQPSGWSANKLFAAGPDQPITALPLVTEHPQGGHLVSVGTGKLAEATDKLSKAPQAFYSIWDSPGRTGEVSLASLQSQSITEELTVNGQDYFRTSTNAVDWSTQDGWYLPLVYEGVEEGERVIFPAQTTEGRVVFVTAKIDTGDPCVSTGSGRLVELDLLTGSMLSYTVLDTNGDGIIDDGDAIVAGLDINGGLPGMPVIIDQGSNKPTQTKAVLLSSGEAVFLDERARSAGTSRRIMWRQLQ